MVSLKKSTNTITLRPTIITPKDWDILDKIEAYLNGVEAGAAPGLFSRALVGSAERTLQGEVFHALRTSAYGTQTVLEANVSDWNDLLRRNIDVSVFDNYPAQKTGTFIELGHYTHAQPNPPRNILIKIHEDFAKQLRSKQTLRNKQCIATPTSCSGGTLHCMFVTALDSELPPNGVKKPGINWPPLLKYFADSSNPFANTLVTIDSTLAGTGSKTSRGKHFDAMGALYLGCVEGVPETVQLGALSVTGRVDRFYCYLPRNSHLLPPSPTPTPCTAVGCTPSGKYKLPDSLTEMVNSQENEAQASGS